MGKYLEDAKELVNLIYDKEDISEITILTFERDLELLAMSGKSIEEIKQSFKDKINKSK